MIVLSVICYTVKKTKYESLTVMADSAISAIIKIVTYRSFKWLFFCIHSNIVAEVF